METTFDYLRQFGPLLAERFRGLILPAKLKRSILGVGRLTHLCRAFLLRPKCLHGVDGGGAASGNHGRDQAGDREQCTDG